MIDTYCGRRGEEFGGALTYMYKRDFFRLGSCWSEHICRLFACRKPTFGQKAERKKVGIVNPCQESSRRMYKPVSCYPEISEVSWTCMAAEKGFAYLHILWSGLGRLHCLHLPTPLFSFPFLYTDTSISVARKITTISKITESHSDLTSLV
jgi:hypothetical protein